MASYGFQMHEACYFGEEGIMVQPRTVTPHPSSLLTWEEPYHSEITLAVQTAEVSAFDTDLYKLSSPLKTSGHMQNLLAST